MVNRFAQVSREQLSFMRASQISYWKLKRRIARHRQWMQIAVPEGPYPGKAEAAADGHRGPQIGALPIGYWLCFSVFVTTMLCACATSHGASQQSSTSPAQSETHHIYVTSGNLNGECYKDLGPVTVTESFAQSVVKAGDSQARQLRQLAQEKYASEVDAVINVHQQQNDLGTAVQISGEAVQIENHETVTCMARGVPAVADVAAATAAGGIVGGVIGGLAGSAGDAGVTGAEMGGAIGASAVAGIELARHLRQQQAQEVFISDRLQQQQNEITQLYQQLTKLIGQQCDTEKLSEQDCEQNILAIQQQIAQPAQPAQESKLQAAAGTSASASTMTDFQVRNRIQEQQEIIDELQQRIAQIKQSTDAQ
jgi:hypothetical protein